MSEQPMTLTEIEAIKKRADIFIANGAWANSISVSANELSALCALAKRALEFEAWLEARAELLERAIDGLGKVEAAALEQIMAIFHADVERKAGAR